ncbi:cofactor-independent phosphoglycerate mutase [bacterium]|nr:cofactor-independent phosphoglycerate mutase [bacterium]
MKAVVILGDGMADVSVPELDGKTPLMAAHTPAMDRIAKLGRNGLFRSIPDDMPTGSAVANLSVLGYDPHICFQGRGVLEAASLGIPLEADDLALRVNVVCIENGLMKSHSAGHISSEEAAELIHDIDRHFRPEFRLYPGLSYRHILVLPGGHPGITCMPPHDHLGESADALMIRSDVKEAADTAERLNGLIRESRKLLGTHPVNRKRRDEGKLPANSLWPWSPGRKPAMATFQERFGVRGAAISAVDLIKGLAVYAGMDVISVKGATGLYDTNYEGKADAALDALGDHDFVFVHVEAADEAGHEKDLNLKIRCIEDIDSRLVQRILDGLARRHIEAVVAVLPDHPTPVSHGAHTRDPIPVAVWNTGEPADGVEAFDEESAKSGILGMMQGDEFIRQVLGKNKIKD